MKKKNNRKKWKILINSFLLKIVMSDKVNSSDIEVLLHDLYY